MPKTLFGSLFIRLDEASFLRQSGEYRVVTCESVVEIYADTHYFKWRDDEFIEHCQRAGLTMTNNPAGFLMGLYLEELGFC